MTARSVVDVVLGEAVSGTRAQRYEDMIAIASVISNRARSLGVSPQQVVANRNEFNAYGKALPSGVNAYRDLAERALREVELNGPVHGATFYATPSAVKNLPKGLSPVASTTGHRYFTDPQNRAIGTAVGYRQPSQSPTTATAYAGTPAGTGATRAIEGGLLASSQVPTPTRRPGGLLDNPDVIAASRVPTGLLATQPATKGARVSNLGVLAEARPSTGSIPTPTAREVAAPATLGQRLAGPNLSRDWGPNPAPQALLDRYAETRPNVKGGRVGPSTAVASRTGLTPAQEQNVASRIGTIEPTRTVQPSRAAQFGRAAAGVLGVSPAAAAELPAGTRPTTSGFAGAVGSPRSMERALPAGAYDGLLASSRVAPQNAGLLSASPIPTAAPRPSPITTSRTIADSTRVAQPQRTQVAAPTARPQTATDTWSGMRSPVQSYAPQEAPTATARAERREKSWQERAAVVGGGLLGSAVAGPVGGILGGALVDRQQRAGEPRSIYDTPSRNAAQMGLLGGGALLGTAIGGPIGGVLGYAIGNHLVTRGVGNGGYSGNLPSAPGRVTDRQARELERSLAERRSGGEGPSMSREARDSISSGRAGGGLF